MTQEKLPHNQHLQELIEWAAKQPFDDDFTYPPHVKRRKPDEPRTRLRFGEKPRMSSRPQASTSTPFQLGPLPFVPPSSGRREGMGELTEAQQDRLETLPPEWKIVRWADDGPVLKAPDGRLRKLTPGGYLVALREKVTV
jgi:hypothetical protein